MTEQQVVDLMSSATSEDDWNNKCDQVKKACNGYPDFWFPLIIVSGLAHRIQATW